MHPCVKDVMMVARQRVKNNRKDFQSSLNELSPRNAGRVI